MIEPQQMPGPENIDHFNSIIKYRRSSTPPLYVKGKVIPQEIIQQILVNANYAPNHKKTEPWRFTIFTGEGLKKLSEMQADIYKKYAGEKFSELKLRKLVDFPLMCSHIIAIGMKRDEAKRIREIEEIEAVACAVQNMFLTATAYGLGAYWSTGGITYFEESKPYFNLGEEDHLLGFFHLGYLHQLSGEGYKRGSIDDKVKWVRE
jgi:nitroreductase